MKIIHITDPHIVAPGKRVFTLDPAKRLQAVFDHVTDTQADADLVVITGDLTDNGDPEAYALLSSMIAGLPMPVRLLLGNHDCRETFRSIFPDQPVDGNGFVQSVMQVPDLADRLIFLDTNSPGEAGGRFCTQRAEWLRDQLLKAPAAAVSIFLHHPPIAHHMVHFDRIGLHDMDQLMDMLHAHPGGVRHMFFGHIHIPMSGTTARGIGFSSGRGCCHQFRQELNNPTPDWVAGAPNYSVIELTIHGITCYGIDTLDALIIAKTSPCTGL